VIAVAMNGDERSIRDVVKRWHEATARGDVETISGLMTEDVMFLVAGEAPMRGREAFVASLRAVLESHRIESSGDVREVAVSGDLAYCRTSLDVAMTPRSGGTTRRRAGTALSIFRKDASGTWRLSRDANLLPPP
jgi:uncharacterized protein (TIGR02246 family)